MNYLSLYCGGGGLDYGFDQLGFKCLGAFDIDANAVSCYNQNYGNTATQVDLSDRRFHVNGLEQVDMVISGSPCQGFSTLGKRNFDDPRNHLLIRAVEIALQHKAKLFVAENVPGARSGQHGEWWERANEILSDNGYATTTVVISADDYGVPQTRKRVFLIGATGKNKDILGKASLPPKRKAKTIGQVLNGSTHGPVPDRLRGTDLMIAKKIKQGQKLCDVRGGDASVHTWQIPQVFGKVDNADILLLQTLMKARRAKSNRTRTYGDGDFVRPQVLERMLGRPVKARIQRLTKMGYIRTDKHNKVNLSHTFNGKYRRLSLDGYSPTVDTNFGNPRYFLHPTEHRGLSSGEAALIQGFPKKYKFSGSETQKMRLIGNAVPPPVSKAIANYAENILGSI